MRARSIWGSQMIKRYSDHAANERTFLAWVRTAIAVMAFGFVIERFDLFLQIAAPQLAQRQLVQRQLVQQQLVQQQEQRARPVQLAPQPVQRPR